jgi:cyclophilin family peptidyl-prolyl cis-trans isomerase
MLFSSASPRRQIALSQGGFAWHECGMKISRFAITALGALCLTASVSRAQTSPPAPPAIPSPGEIVAAAPASEWTAIAASDLLVMDLAAEANGKARRVVIQLMPAPFSQGWIGNIRKLAAAKFWDGLAIVRVQDNYVTQWGDPDGEVAGKAKKLPDGLASVPESEYVVDANTLSESNSSDKFFTSEGVTAEVSALFRRASDPKLSEKEQLQSVDAAMRIIGLSSSGEISEDEQAALLSIASTQTELTSQGWHERDGFAEWVEIWNGWPIANAEKGRWLNDEGKEIVRPKNTQFHILAKEGIHKEVEESKFWPTHCYGMVGVGRNLSPDTGTGAELYTVIGHAPRHLDRNIALVGRIIEGMEHMSSLPRGTGALGFYEKPEERTGILSVRLGGEVPGMPAYEYLNTESKSFAKYADARANRRDPFFIKPAGGADICNIPVPVRRKK